MQEEDKLEFGRQIALLSGAYRQPIDSVAIEAYWLVLEDLDLKEIERAIRKVLFDVDAEFMPRPAQIRAKVVRPKSKLPYHEEWKGHEWEKPKPWENGERSVRLPYVDDDRGER